MAVAETLVESPLSDALHIDIETFSECDLKSCGAYKYAEDPSTELLSVAYAFGQDDPWLWVPLDRLPAKVEEGLRARGVTSMRVGRRPPDELRSWVRDHKQLRAHNSQFERTQLNNHAGRKVDFPATTNEQWYCVASKCRAMSIPGKLEDAANALGTHPKDKHGHNDMLALSKPRTGKERRWTPENAPERFVNLYCYNLDDVRAEQGLDEALPDLTPAEREVFLLDQRINDRGWAVDLEAVADVRYLIAQYKTELGNLCWDITGYSPTQREKIANWVRWHGYPQLLDMQAETIKDIVRAHEGEKHDWLTVLKIYSTYGMKAVAKYETILDMVCADGRLRGMFLYYGAGTGRWSSLGVQLQNLFRPVIEDPETAVDLFKWRDLKLIKWMYDGIDPMKVFASCVRSVLVGGRS